MDAWNADAAAYAAGEVLRMLDFLSEHPLGSRRRHLKVDHKIRKLVLVRSFLRDALSADTFGVPDQRRRSQGCFYDVRQISYLVGVDRHWQYPGPVHLALRAVVYPSDK